MVSVISREFEKVLVEQYQCQGLSTVTHSCPNGQHEEKAQELKGRAYCGPS